MKIIEQQTKTMNNNIQSIKISDYQIKQLTQIENRSNQSRYLKDIIPIILKEFIRVENILHDWKEKDQSQNKNIFLKKHKIKNKYVIVENEISLLTMVPLVNIKNLINF